MKMYQFMLVIVAMALIACGKNGHNESESQQFSLMEIKPRNITLKNTYSASIRGQQDIRIIPRVDGYLTEVLIREGERVRKGQTLFIIDQVSYKAALQAAKANVAVSEAGVANAELIYDSKKALFDKKVVSTFDLVSAENMLKTVKANFLLAKSQEDAAKNNLSFTIIESPSDGVVGKIPYRKGDYVGPGIKEGLTIVADNSQMYVYFSMTERQILDLHKKYFDIEKAIEQMPDISLELSNKSIYVHSGKIESISGVVDASTGTASVRVSFPNKEGVLLSGGAGSVIVPYYYNNVIIIPQEATFEILNKTYVYKVVDGVAISTIVDIEQISNGKEYIVTKGLSDGDTIIADGAGLIREGTTVTNTEK